MLKKDLQKFIANGFKKTLKSNKKFEQEHKEISDEMDSFETQMKDWSSRRKSSIRNK